MFGLLRRVLRGEDVPEPVLTPPGFAGATVPPMDTDEPAPTPPPIAEEAPPGLLANRAFVICYEDSTGAESERRIVCHEVYTAGGLVYVKARCLERKAPRTFRVDRISEVFCGVTGEDLGAPDKLFVSTGERVAKPRPSETERGLQRGLQILATMARCDGRVHPAEDAAMRDFVVANAPKGMGAADIESLINYGRRQAPSFDTFLTTYERLLRYDRNLLPAVLQSAIRVAEADGEWRQEEVETMKDLVIIARAEGVPVDIAFDA